MILFGFGLGNEALYFNMGSSNGCEEEQELLLVLVLCFFFFFFLFIVCFSSWNRFLAFYLVLLFDPWWSFWGSVCSTPSRLCLCGALGICPGWDVGDGERACAGPVVSSQCLCEAIPWCPYHSRALSKLPLPHSWNPFRHWKVLQALPGALSALGSSASWVGRRGGCVGLESLGSAGKQDVPGSSGGWAGSALWEHKSLTAMKGCEDKEGNSVGGRGNSLGKGNAGMLWMNAE